MRSITRPASLGLDHAEADLLERDRQRIGQRGLGGDALEIDAEMHDRLRDLRPDAR
jgi:hypothetical protein